MSKDTPSLRKKITGNSGNASNGKWTLTACNNELKDSSRRETKGPKNRG